MMSGSVINNPRIIEYDIVVNISLLYKENKRATKNTTRPVLVRAFTRSLKQGGRPVDLRFHCAIHESVNNTLGSSHHAGAHIGTLTILLLIMFLIVLFS